MTRTSAKRKRTRLKKNSSRKRKIRVRRKKISDVPKDTKFINRKWSDSKGAADERECIDISNADENTISTKPDQIMMGLCDEARVNIRSLHLTERQLRLLINKSLYVDDTVMQAGNILLKETFPAVAGFEDTLFQQRPQLRSR